MDDCVEMFEDIVSERTFSQCRFGDVGLRIQRKETTFNNNVWMQGIIYALLCGRFHRCWPGHQTSNIDAQLFTK